MSNNSPVGRALNFLSQRSKTTGIENLQLLQNRSMKNKLLKEIKLGGSSRKMAKKGSSKLMRIPQNLVNTALKIVKKTRKGAVKVTKRAGKGMFKVAGITVNTTAGIAKDILGTLSAIGINTTRGASKAVKNSVGSVAGVTKGTLRGIRRAVGRKSRRNITRRNNRR